MNKAKQQLEQARYTRDTAREIVDADLSYIKLMLQPQQIAHRVQLEAEQLADKAREIYEENPKAVKQAGAAAAAIAVIGLVWAGLSRRKSRKTDDDTPQIEQQEHTAQD